MVSMTLMAYLIASLPANQTTTRIEGAHDISRHIAKPLAAKRNALPSTILDSTAEAPFLGVSSPPRKFMLATSLGRQSQIFFNDGLPTLTASTPLAQFELNRGGKDGSAPDWQPTSFSVLFFIPSIKPLPKFYSVIPQDFH
jgi:hypothetical protein